MALKFVLTKEERDALSKDLQKVYVQDGENWNLDMQDVTKHPRTLALKKALDEERISNKKLKALTATGDETETDTDDIVAKKIAKQDKLIREHEASATEWKAKAHSSIIEAASANAITKAKVRAGPLVQAYLRTVSSVDEHGVVYIKNDDGSPMLRKGAVLDTDYLSLSDYVGTLRENEDFAVAFEPKGASGGNAQQTTTNSDLPVGREHHGGVIFEA